MGLKRVINFLQEVAGEVKIGNVININCPELLEGIPSSRALLMVLLIKSFFWWREKRLYLLKLLLEKPNVLPNM